MQVQTVTDFKNDLPSASPAIQARGLTKLFGDFPALQNVSFEVERGEYLALLGHNGAGKTTLLKLLALLTRPSFGKLEIVGVDHTGDLSQVRRRLGLLGHNTFLYDDLTAEENLLFYARLYGVSQARPVCQRRLEAVGLASFG